MAERRIGVVGFGFSGLMVVANLVREAAAGTILYIIADRLDPVGVAYSTLNPHHLLNVPAAKMGAFPEDLEAFYRWLQTAEAAVVKQRAGITQTYGPDAFVPRMLYAAYLETIWQKTQQLASERKLSLKLVESQATAILPGTPLSLLTGRGDAIALDQIILATGNETKPILPQLPAGVVIQNPWLPEAWDGAKNWSSPVVLMGTGLTAVDTVITLRDAGYAGEIIAYSRRGLLPCVHMPAASIFTFDKTSVLAQHSLAGFMHFLRENIVHHKQWRPVIDALRPHTQARWQRFSTPDQKRFFRRLSTIWSVHRHRMAPEIAAQIETEMAAGRLRIFSGTPMEATMPEGRAQVIVKSAEGTQTFTPSHIINCTGPEMNIARSAQPLFKHALANGVIEPHATNIGIAADPQLRVWGVCHPNLYAIGTLLTGQLLESTAVPELRVQAQEIARAITH